MIMACHSAARRRDDGTVAGDASHPPPRRLGCLAIRPALSADRYPCRGADHPPGDGGGGSDGCHGQKRDLAQIEAGSGVHLHVDLDAGGVSVGHEGHEVSYSRWDFIEGASLSNPACFQFGNGDYPPVAFAFTECCVGSHWSHPFGRQARSRMMLPITPAVISPCRGTEVVCLPQVGGHFHFSWNPARLPCSNHGRSAL